MPCGLCRTGKIALWGFSRSEFVGLSGLGYLASFAFLMDYEDSESATLRLTVQRRILASVEYKAVCYHSALLYALYGSELGSLLLS